MMANADDLLRDYGAGRMTFQELFDQFGKLKKVPKKPEPKNWAQVYAQAEEGDDSVPMALYRAQYAGNITADEESKLLAVYRKNNSSLF